MAQNKPLAYKRKSTNVHKIVISCGIQHGTHPLRTLSQKKLR